MIFAGPKAENAGTKVDQIDLAAPQASGGKRSFAQALLFGPEGRLFGPITGGASAGQVRRYDVETKQFDVFASVTTPAEPQPQWYYLTFGKTNPSTLKYGSE